MLAFRLSSIVKRVLIPLILILFSTGQMCSQHPISRALWRLIESGNYDEARESIKGYRAEEIAELPDSTLLEFFYLKGLIKEHEGNEEDKRKYLIEAKKLCERSLGIHSPVYLEICWAIGKSYEDSGDRLSAFETYLPALIQSRGYYWLDEEDVKWQYEEINSKVIEWYKDEALRKMMIANRENLSNRDKDYDTVQHDLEFYLRYGDDEPLRTSLFKAEALEIASRWIEAAQLYLDVAGKTQDNFVAKATVQQRAAKCYIDVGDMQKAEELLLDNLDMLSAKQQFKIYRITLSQLANLYNSIHNYSKAKYYADTAKFWYEENLDFSKDYILCLHRCSNIERGNGKYFLALLMEDVALQELHRNKTYAVLSGDDGLSDSFEANLLSSAALHYRYFGFREDAYASLERAIAIAETTGIDASPYYNNMRDICWAEKDFDKAVAVQEKAYAISKIENRKINIGIGLCLSQLLARQPISSMVPMEVSKLMKENIQSTFTYASMDDRRQYWKYYEHCFPIINFLAYESMDPEMYGCIYDNILLEKGLLLRTATNLREQLIKSGDSADLENYERLLELRKSLSSPPSEEVRTLGLEIEKLDKSLAKKYSSFSDYEKSFSVSWIDVRNRLGSDDIAIEFYNIPEPTWGGDVLDSIAQYRYCAGTVKKDYDSPHIIPICSGQTLDGLCWEDMYATDSLYRVLWRPLEEELNGIRNVYFSAYGPLHNIGIEYARMPDGRNISDCYELHRVSSTRVLTESLRERRIDNAILYGGLKYDMDKDDLIAQSHAGQYHPESASRAITEENLRYGVKYLPGTLNEVEEISHHFESKPTVVTDVNGTEESFKLLGDREIDILHLATHGFFWSEEDARKRDYVSFLNPEKMGERSAEDKAFTRSGICLSGANVGLRGDALPDDVEDGVLTALELSNMNLGNVDMVVMSACESGLGETTGEGVFGLQRGFKLAGANTLLMSLWKVDDEATQLLMTEFYRNYLSGKSKHESLKLAQQTLRTNPKYSDPEYWAAFILLDGLN